MRFLKFETILLIFGFIVGMGLCTLSTLFSQWTPLAKVSETPAELFYRFEDRTIFVKTTSDHVFSCPWVRETCSLVDGAIDFEASEFKFRTEKSYNGLRPFPPGTVVASVFIEELGIEWSTDRYIIALDNGSLYTWSMAAGGNAIPYMSGCFGGMVGVSWGIILYSFVGVFSRRSRGKLKNDEKPL